MSFTTCSRAPRPPSARSGASAPRPSTCSARRWRRRAARPQGCPRRNTACPHSASCAPRCARWASGPSRRCEAASS
eukprot:scaffold62033_cov68-Phaeocystis_antarctica.AAC.2